MKLGWKSLHKKVPFILFLSVYQLLWGLFLYKFIQSIAIPLLRRFPGQELTDTTVQVYWAEAQFQVMKTDITYRYLSIMLAILLFRMLLTPLINAGLYYTIHHTGTQQKSFLNGVRSLGKSFIFIYWGQLTITLAPLYWLTVKLKEISTHHHSYDSMLTAALPFVTGFILYGCIVHLCCIGVQWGQTTQRSLLHTLTLTARLLVPFIGISLIFLLLSGLALLVTISLSILWSGLFAIIAHQIYYFVRTLISVWGITVQYHVWSKQCGLVQ